MRIRTVKPEFWTHPVMARLDPETQLLALALLNYADDHGYFRAEPSLVRSACRPFSEDSLSVHGALTTLEKVDWIEVRDTGATGIIGRIVTWHKHQRVNRPSDSKLKPYWLTESSLNPHCALTEPSVQEQGKERNTPIVPRGDENPEPPAEEKPEILLRAMALFRMRPGTPLDRSTRRAWKLAAPAVTATTEPEWLQLEAYYADDIPDKHDYRRRDLSTLLNNWSGELIKAVRFCERQGWQPEKSEKKEEGPPPPDDLWREVLRALYPESDPAVYRTWAMVPDSLRVEILEAIALAEKEAA
jgi:hypothetical protein